MQLGKIKYVDIRKLWKHEANDFTVWLENHIDYLNDVLDFDITVESREEAVGPFRVDLLGEDNFGSRVIIENQLEKSDHDHLGKVLTYLANLEASRAVWICKEPREEHERVFDWLNENTPDSTAFYLVKLEAIQIGEQDMAAPLFSVVRGPSIEAKARGQEKNELSRRHHLRLEFWEQYIEYMNDRCDNYRNTSPTKASWLTIGIGMTNVEPIAIVGKSFARVELYMSHPDQDRNKAIFDRLYEQRDSIEAKYGGELNWNRLDNKKASRIDERMTGVSLYNKEDWPTMIEFLSDRILRIVDAFTEPVQALKNKL